MKYCQVTTESHPLAIAHPQFVEDINAIALAEGYIQPPIAFSNNETAINLDKVKRPVFVAQGVDLPKSMDMTVGLKSNDALQKEMLLVDFKLNVENPTRIRKIDMLEKVEHSSLLLGTAIPIRDEYIFVLQTAKVQEARRWFSRYHARIPQTYIAMDINTLKATYFD